ncbi:toll-like receptor 5 [Anolis carolinensis]|uniref:toll-like receptor 5 n=1 Tax=Anolis carolinensis TaxID=28377 RepID=UPI002F2B38AB
MRMICPRRTCSGAPKVVVCLALALLLGQAAEALPRCHQATVNSLRVANCQAQRHNSFPEVDPSVQVLFLNFNAFSSIVSSSVPALRSLLVLSLGKQLVGSLFVGERAFRNVPGITFLDLGGNLNLTLHPDALRGLSKLEVLLLDANGLDEGILEEGYFRDLVSLKRLDLSGNRLHRLKPDATFQGLRNLKTLQLKLNQISAICGDDLRNLQGRHLDVLDLSSNRLVGSPSCGNPFLGITLRMLDVSSNAWNAEKVEQFFTQINGTEILNLRMQHSGALGSGFGFRNLKGISASTFAGLRHSSVFSLDISNGFLSELVSSAFSAFPDLNVLLLRSNQIGQIQDGAFAGLKKLLVLDLSGNLLGALYEESLRALRSSPLQHLLLTSNHLGAIQHNALEGLDSLETLDLEDNALSKIPTGNLPSLLRLTLRRNRIRDAWGIERIGKNLTHLDLSSNRLMDLGSLWGQLGGLPDLRSLNLSGNGLEQCFWLKEGPRRLREMDLSHNNLGKVWGSKRCLNIFQGLEELVGLNLSSNRIHNMPRHLLQPLRSLQRLDLSDNLLHRLPEWVFYGLTSLLDLRLSGNPLVTLSPSLFRPLEHLRILDLRDLSLLCDCEMSDLQRWYQERKATLKASAIETTLSCLRTHPTFQWLSLPSFLESHCSK